jgi:enoyl-[acyl-carrier protein] reductase II
MAAAFALGAEGVQIGTRFAATLESSAADRYKQAVVEAGEADTVLSLKSIGPVRMIRNSFAQRCVEAEKRGASADELRALLGDKRERQGIFEGDWEEGQLEAGMGAGLIREILPAAAVIEKLVREYENTLARLVAAPKQ